MLDLVRVELLWFAHILHKYGIFVADNRLVISFSITQLPITHYLLPITYYLLPITDLNRYQMTVSYALLRIL